jgi:hypothetical protein
VNNVGSSLSVGNVVEKERLFFGSDTERKHKGKVLSDGNNTSLHGRELTGMPLSNLNNSIEKCLWEVNYYVPFIFKELQIAREIFPRSEREREWKTPSGENTKELFKFVNYEVPSDDGVLLFYIYLTVEQINSFSSIQPFKFNVSSRIRVHFYYIVVLHSSS